MRASFCDSILKLSSSPDFVFLTGDLGFMALEPLRDAAGVRFINAGIAEQNMVAAAVGMAAVGLRPWVYSIAPFIYARAYEQIRNDVVMHGANVKLVGNGGGFGYGVMGKSHHAIEDFAALRGLGLKVYIPAFPGDVDEMVARMAAEESPAYLRLGKYEGSWDGGYSPWRKAFAGTGSIIVACGPLAGGILAAMESVPPGRAPTLWVISELPAPALPDEFIADLDRCVHSGASLFVAEEHVSAGGLGESLAASLMACGRPLPPFVPCHASYTGKPLGSQAWLRSRCGLDPLEIVRRATNAMS